MYTLKPYLINCQKNLNFFQRIDTIYLGTISPSLHEQLLHVQIPNLKKDTDDLTVFFAHLGSVHVKDTRKMLVKLTPGFVSSHEQGTVSANSFANLGQESIKKK